jgi:predicted PolB exonuclease-like 3'-5' exonuclease
MFAFDIETIPNLDMVDRLPEPEVKLGNLKDPVKIAEKCAEAKQNQIGSMALNPFYGRICSYAIWNEEVQEYSTVDEISDAAEIETIRNALECFCFTATTTPSVITWNGFGFDLPFLYKRAAILKIELPVGCVGLQYWMKKYSHHPHCDLERELSNWDTKRIKLDDAAGVFLSEKKLDHDFSKFIELINTGKSSEIGIYNLKDSEITYRLYKTLSPYLF